MMIDGKDASDPEPASTSGDFGTELVERLAGREGNFNRYEHKGELARGGQGAILRVWDEDLRRNLAMKVTLAQSEAAGTSEVDPKTLGRFLEEAQVTGQLDHPGIVPIHELGLDHEGGVYFTMRLVKGIDLARVFEKVPTGEEGWNKTRVLGVLLKVCEALSYAHSKRVIHRDLKPANIMVGRFGEVYVMDWGLARVLGSADRKDIRVRPASSLTMSRVQSDRREQAESADSPLVTMDGDVLGTPAYMSPEQARGDLEAMGPASDVYSMGAILYQLLASHMPYVPPDARLNAYAVWGLVQNGPPTPVSQIATDAPAELVAICEKAMAREVADRYADMRELAEDVRAFVEHRVVHAYRTGPMVELRKWVERNRGLAVSMLALVVLTVAGSTTAAVVLAAKNQSIQLARDDALAEKERADAAAQSETRLRESEARLRMEAEEAAQTAIRAQAASENITDFLVGQFEALEPETTRGRPPQVSDLLARAARSLEDEMAQSPVEAARLRGVLGGAYYSLGQYESAEALLERAWREYDQFLGADDPNTLTSLHALADLYHSQGRYAEAEPLFVQVLEKRRTLLGEEDPATLTSLSSLALLYSRQGRYTEAELLYVQSLEKRRTLLGEDDSATLHSLSDLAGLHILQERFADAEPLLVRALEGNRTVLGEDHPSTLSSLSNLALLYEFQGRVAEAEPLSVRALEGNRTVLGEDHPDTLTSLHNLATLYQRQERFAEAEPLLVKALERKRAVLGEDHPDTLMSLNNLGGLYDNQGRFAEAEPLLVQALEGSRAVLSEDHPQTLIILDNLSSFYRDWLSSRRRVLGEHHPDTLGTKSRLGVLLWSQASYGVAEPLLIDCLEKRRRVLGENHPDTLASLYDVAQLHESLERWEDAEVAAGMLLELTPLDAPEYAERERLLERILRAQEGGE